MLGLSGVGHTDICGNPRVGVADIFLSLCFLSPSSLEIWLRMTTSHEGKRNVELLLVKLKKTLKIFKFFFLNLAPRSPHIHPKSFKEPRSTWPQSPGGLCCLVSLLPLAGTEWLHQD